MYVQKSLVNVRDCTYVYPNQRNYRQLEHFNIETFCFESHIFTKRINCERLIMGNSASMTTASGKEANIFNFTVENLDGEPVEMNSLRGAKAYILVNTASQ